jgi:hypothetical protein
MPTKRRQHRPNKEPLQQKKPLQQKEMDIEEVYGSG